MVDKEARKTFFQVLFQKNLTDEFLKENLEKNSWSLEKTLKDLEKNQKKEDFENKFEK